VFISLRQGTVSGLDIISRSVLETDMTNYTSETVLISLRQGSVSGTVRPIPVSGIGRYSPVTVGISILIGVSAPIPVVLSFVYLSQQSTMLQCTPIVSSLYRIFAHTPIIHI